MEKIIILDRLNIATGTVPDIALSSIEKYERSVSCSRASRIIPLNEFLVKASVSRDDKFPNDGGILPLKLL